MEEKSYGDVDVLPFWHTSFCFNVCALPEQSKWGFNVWTSGVPLANPILLSMLVLFLFAKSCSLFRRRTFMPFGPFSVRFLPKMDCRILSGQTTSAL